MQLVLAVGSGTPGVCAGDAEAVHTFIMTFVRSVVEARDGILGDGILILSFGRQPAEVIIRPVADIPQPSRNILCQGLLSREHGQMKTVRNRKMRKCKSCKRPFQSRRVSQILCSDDCRREWRKEYMKKYMRAWKMKHPNYWNTEKQRNYLKNWRERHPTYFKRWYKMKKAKEMALCSSDDGR